MRKPTTSRILSNSQIQTWWERWMEESSFDWTEPDPGTVVIYKGDCYIKTDEKNTYLSLTDYSICGFMQKEALEVTDLKL
ncbi:MAG: hypothetical protein JRC86_13235 [Deltaproteobacteria bacterium]|nr:hypothetical protein [Deltaproteobacteria bacterium]